MDNQATSDATTMAVAPAPSVARATVLVRAPSTVAVGTPFTLRVWPEKADVAPEFRTGLKLSLAGPPDVACSIATP